MSNEEKATRDRIHEVATRTFLDKGFRDASLRSIVKEAGVTTGSFYWYYKSKEKLFDALVGEHYRHIMQMYQDSLDQFWAMSKEEQKAHMGEIGGELSGGERQRISIARAFLKNAPIILLDEATASLDVENETMIQSALSRLIQNKTVLVIAHRMRTVSGTDKIVVLKDGVVAEEGSPQTLRQQGGIFAGMVETQLEGQNWAIS